MSSTTKHISPPATAAMQLTPCSMIDHSRDYAFNHSPQPPQIRRSRSPMNNPPSNPTKEWMKLVDAAERRKIQNRKAQRKYRQSLKKRIQDLERQGASTTSAAGPSATLLPLTPPGQSRVMSNHTMPVPNPMPNNRVIPETSPSMQQQHTPPDWIPQTSVSSMLDDCDPPYEDFFSFTSSSSLNPQVDMSMSVEGKWIDQPGNPERIQLLSNLSDCMHQNTEGVEDMEEATPSVSSEELQVPGSCHSSSICSPGGISCNWENRGSGSQGRNPLHLAARRGFQLVVRLLLEQGMDVNAKDDNGWTALHLAAEKGHHAVVRLLLDHGADHHAKTEHASPRLRYSSPNLHPNNRALS